MHSVRCATISSQAGVPKSNFCIAETMKCMLRQEYGVLCPALSPSAAMQEEVQVFKDGDLPILCVNSNYAFYQVWPIGCFRLSQRLAPC